MREILFRGKRVDNGMWVFGFYIENELFDGGLEPSIIPVDEKGAALYDDDGYNIEIKVNPKTVGQYTGLTDKNGVKIFEGDILHATLGNFVVRWSDNISGFVAEGKERAHPCMNRGTMKCYEIIGNIYDNPELVSAVGWGEV